MMCDPGWPLRSWRCTGGHCFCRTIWVYGVRHKACCMCGTQRAVEHHHHHHGDSYSEAIHRLSHG